MSQLHGVVALPLMPLWLPDLATVAEAAVIG